MDERYFKILHQEGKHCDGKASTSKLPRIFTTGKLEDVGTFAGIR